MHLRRIQPDGRDKPVMQFECDCGFDYRMSAQAPADALRL
jgi:hypothetical protein